MFLKKTTRVLQLQPRQPNGEPSDDANVHLNGNSDDVSDELPYIDSECHLQVSQMMVLI